MPHQHPEAKARELLKHAISTAQAAQEELRALRERNGNEQATCHGGNHDSQGEEDEEDLYKYGSTPHAKKTVFPLSASSNRCLRRDGGNGAVRPRRPKEGRTTGIEKEDVDREMYKKGRRKQSRNPSPPSSNSTSPSLLTMKQKRRDAKLHELKARVERLLLREEHVDVVERGENEQDEDVEEEVRGRQTMNRRVSPANPSHVLAVNQWNASPPPPPQPGRCQPPLHSESRMGHHRPLSPHAAVISTSSHVYSSSSSASLTLLERALAAKRQAKLLSASASSSSSSSSSTLGSYHTPAAAATAAAAADAATAASTVQTNFAASRQSWQQQSTASSVHHDAWVWPRLTKEEMQEARRKPLRPSGISNNRGIYT